MLEDGGINANQRMKSNFIYENLQFKAILFMAAI